MSKALIKLIHSNTGRQDTYTVFRDFVEMAALALANSVDRRPAREQRESRYMQIVGQYSPEEVNRFASMLGQLTIELEQDPRDVLGETFMHLDLGNEARGQFFTPYELCRLMAGLTCDVESMKARIAQQSFITVSEPACGAGAMMIAVAESLRAAGINYQQHLHATCVDIDARAVHMAYIQLSLLHIPAVVVRGNTLTLEELDHWYTPAHILGGWDGKLAKARIEALQVGVPANSPQLELLA